MIRLTSNDVKKQIQDQAILSGDPFAIQIYGPQSDTWNDSSEENGKDKIMTVFTKGIAHAITGSLGPTGEFDKIITNTVESSLVDTNIIQCITGDFSTITSDAVISTTMDTHLIEGVTGSFNQLIINNIVGKDVTDDIITQLAPAGITGSIFKYKKRTFTYKSGTLINISVESNWIYI